MSFCTYITVHQASGYYYLGKSFPEHIVNDGYKGSGTKLKRFFKKYPKKEWDCGILWEFETAAEAYSDEGGIVDEECLKDPFCLNLTLGGLGVPEGTKPWNAGKKGQGLTRAQHTPESIAACAEKRRGGTRTPEQCDNISKGREAGTTAESIQRMVIGKLKTSHLNTIPREVTEFVMSLRASGMQWKAICFVTNVPYRQAQYLYKREKKRIQNNHPIFTA